MEVKDYYNQRYAERNNIKPRKAVCRFVKRYLKKGMKVLDIGCGEGRHLRYAISRGCDGYGIDISEEGVRQTNLSVGKDVATTKTTEMFSDGSFNGIICNRVIEYNDSPGVIKAFSEIGRLLTSGGYGLITTRSTKQPPKEGEEFVRESPLGGMEYKTPYDGLQHYFSREELEWLSEKASGLSVHLLKLRESAIDPDGKARDPKYEWVLIVRKP